MPIVKVNNEWELWMPQARADRPEWFTEYGWEKIRIKEMVETISESDIVFYIGAEVGEIAGIVSKYTNCDMVLFEPNERVFPAIEAVWRENKLKEPLGFYSGFVSDIVTDKREIPKDDFKNSGLPLISDHGFDQLCENRFSTFQITIDEYCKRTGIFPTIISCDIEGAEYRILHGANQVLKEHAPIIFLSVHPLIMRDNYNDDLKDMLLFMREIGYDWHCIDYGLHEHHLVFYNKN